MSLLLSFWLFSLCFTRLNEQGTQFNWLLPWGSFLILLHFPFIPLFFFYRLKGFLTKVGFGVVMMFWLIAGLRNLIPWNVSSVTLVAHLIVLCQHLAVPMTCRIRTSLSFAKEKLANILLEADSKDNNTNLQSTTFTTGWAGSNTHAVHLLPGPQSRHVAVSNHTAIDFCWRQQLCMTGNPEMPLPPGLCLSAFVCSLAVPTFRSFLSSSCWPLEPAAICNTSIPKI